MTPLARRTRRRPDMRRVVILFPSGLTLGNLFFGVFAIIAASRLEFVAAGVYVLLGGICDALDGRVARATNAGSEFGEELDSLVDAITFGLAPGMIMYFAVLNRSGWDWVWVFLFTACAVMRLARFNIEQAGTSKTYFQGLPSPAAGITLASYYWFSQSSLYTYGAIADLKWHVLLRYLMVVLSFLMISNVPYPVFPRTGFRTLRAIGASVLVIGSAVLLATRKLEYFFPFALVYVAWGLLRWVFSGLFERRQPTLPYDLSEGEDDDEDEEEFELTASQVHASRQGHREERAQRAERQRAERRLARTERSATKMVAPDREAARPTERPARAPDADRSPRRDRTERPKRGASRSDAAERVERTPSHVRPERVERAPRSPRPEPAELPAIEPEPIVSGVQAITIGQPAGDETTTAPATAVAPVAGAPATEGGAPRKRKRRRRRGERKERPASGEPQRIDGDDAESGADDDSGPYARVDGGGDSPPHLPPPLPSTPPADETVRPPRPSSASE
jgi:CDP-diacylglycerol---serine O-phosphatidyltransferase